MIAEVAPSRAQGAIPPSSKLALLGVAAASLVGAAVFYRILLCDGALRGYDWQSHHFHYFDWVRISLTEYRALPLYMFHAWITPNFLANAEAPQLSPLVWLLFALSTDAYLKLLLLLHTAAAAVGTWALLRDLHVEPPIAAFAGVAFAANGFFVAHLCVGHPWAMGAALLPGLLCLYRRAALGSGRALGAAALLGAGTILGGQHQPFIWQNLFLALFAALWAVRVRALFPLSCWALLALLTGALAAVKLLPMLAEFADYAPQRRTVGFPVSLLPGALLARGRGPESVVPGLEFAHGGGWWEWSYYLGPVVSVWLAVGLGAARRCWTLVAVGVFFLALSLEGPLWSLLRDLPVLRTQRSPSRFLLLSLFAFTIAAALGWQRIFSWARARRPRLALGFAVAAALLAFVDLALESRTWQRAAVGAPLAALDQRPSPPALEAPADARVELREFAPNRFVYRVASNRGGLVVFPLRFAERADVWRIDGLPAVSHRGKLAVDVPPGERDIVMSYRPKYVGAGAAISATAVLALALRALRRTPARAPAAG